MLDWEDLGVSAIYLPDTAWVSPTLGPAPAPSNTSNAANAAATASAAAGAMQASSLSGSSRQPSGSTNSSTAAGGPGAPMAASPALAAAGASGSNLLPGVLPASANQQRFAPNSGSIIAGVPPANGAGLSPLALATRTTSANIIPGFSLSNHSSHSEKERIMPKGGRPRKDSNK